MPTLSQNITNTITYLDEIRDAIIDTGVGMPNTTIVAEYDEWIKRLIPIQLEISESSFSFTAPAASDTFAIVSNTTWTVSVPYWMTVSAQSGEGNALLTVSTTNNTTGSQRRGTITITAKNVIVKTISVTQAEEKWTEGSYTLTVSPSFCSYTQQSASDSGTGTWTVSITSYRSDISNLGNTRDVAQTPTYTESLNFITDVSIANTSGNQYTASITYNKGIAGTGTVTFKNNGQSRSVNCSIIQYSPPVTSKSMTINFGPSGITSAYLFNATVSNMNLSTSTLVACTITATGSVELIWNDSTGITVNTTTGGQTTIYEGDTFYIYYATSPSNIIGGYLAATGSFTLKDGSTVTAR